MRVPGYLAGFNPSLRWSVLLDENVDGGKNKVWIKGERS